MKHKILTEAGIEKHFMTREERILKKKLINLLVKNHHVKYAKRLALFDINIVPLNVKGGGDFTAAISFDDGIIYISQGFLQDEKIFFQLDVILRHELAHNLLMHQIRMAKKLGPKLDKHVNASSSLHDLINIIADLEISNTRYTEEDKKIIRNMWLNGRLISGLVTEDLRKDWLNKPLEAMYDELSADIEQINEWALDAMENPTGTGAAELAKKTGLNQKDFITTTILSKLNYSAASGILDKSSRASGSLQEFIDGKAYIYLGKDPKTGKPSRLYFKDLHSLHQQILQGVNKIITAADSIYQDENELEKVIQAISKTSLLKPYILEDIADSGDIKNQNNVEIIAPEEKFLVIEFLKKASSKIRKAKAKLTVNVSKATHSKEYVDAYNKTIKKFDSSQYSDTELTVILGTLSAALGGGNK